MRLSFYEEITVVRSDAGDDDFDPFGFCGPEGDTSASS